MKAALLRAPGDVSIEEVTEPHPFDGGLRLRVEACAICGTDVKMWREGHRDLRYPRILGHELVGIVERVDIGIHGIEVGDRVQVWPGIACGQCRHCLNAMDNRCQNIGIVGFNLDGGFAEEVSLPSSSLLHGGVNPVPPDLDPIVATLAEPLACCINGQERCGVSSGDRVLIVGAGPIGILHAALAKRSGVETVTMLERDPKRAKMAQQVRPDRMVVGDLDSDLETLSEEGGFDVVIISAPHVEVDMGLVGTLAPGGRLSLFSGLGRAGLSTKLDLNHLHYREISINGSYGCRSKDCAEAIEILTGGEIDLGWLFTMRLKLEDIVNGFRYSLERRGLKAVVTEF